MCRGVHRAVHLAVGSVLEFRLRPFRPSRDLSVVLQGLKGPHFEPLESALDELLTLKTALLLAFSSLKRIGDLQALSVSSSCFLDFTPGLLKVLLRPRAGYVPKVASTPFHSQLLDLQSFFFLLLSLGKMSGCMGFAQ